jgi:2-keto-4-pentenoate hydratase/2-oxohepta-3-ene-1,7-dioic acid hydratase in catechol pathway
MQLARIKARAGQEPIVVAYVGGRMVPLKGSPLFRNITSIISAGKEGVALAQKAANAAAAAGEFVTGPVEFLAPTDPAIYLGLGYNYRALAEHEGKPLDRPLKLFAKFANCVLGHDKTVHVPRAIDKVDYEAELGVVIGKRASRVKKEDALSYVGGYTPCNDLTAKELPRPVDSGAVPLKCIDGFGPLGPVLITADEIADPQKLTLICRVNGEEKQRFPTSDMLHTVAESLEYVTRIMTLEPGDVIATGTSVGIGIIKVPPVFLKPNDVMEIEIEGYPPLRNKLQWEAA